MDRHVRWFRREIAIGIAQRLTAEVLVAGGIALGVLLAQGPSATGGLLGLVLVMPTFAVLRVGLALAANPLNVTYLLRWPQPGSALTSVVPTSSDTPSDSALKHFGFSLLPPFSKIPALDVDY